jgi:hypothetical protein
LIDRILTLNPSADPRWLNAFDPAALHRYHDHLQQALEPRGLDSYWLRDGETPAIVTRAPAA